MKTKLLFCAIQKFKTSIQLNNIFTFLIIIFITMSSFSQENGIEFVFDCPEPFFSPPFDQITVKFDQPDVSGSYYAYPEGDAFDSNGDEIQSNWFVIYVASENRWELKGPTTQDGSGEPSTFFYNNNSDPFPSDSLINWIPETSGGGFPCSLGSIIYTVPTNIDSDGDGFNSSEDCNDNDATINPGATEICDGIDNNCDGNIDEGFDADGDGFTTCGGDCDDMEPAVYPGAEEICDGLDNNCVDGIDENVNDCDNGVIIEYCNDAKTKILVCHNGKDICVSINAKDAHLAHGDFLGSCDNASRKGEAIGSLEGSPSFNVVSYPNPSKNLFNIRIETLNIIDKIRIDAFDINGRLIHSDLVNGNETYEFGANLQSGVYFMNITQAENSKVVKIIKH